MAGNSGDNALENFIIESSFQNGLKNINKTISDISNFMQDIKRTHPITFHLTWLEELLTVYNVAKNILEQVHFKISVNGAFQMITNQSPADVKEKNGIPLNANFLNTNYAELLKKIKIDLLFMDNSFLHAEKISIRVNQLIKFVNLAKYNIDRIVDVLNPPTHGITIQLNSKDFPKEKNDVPRKQLITTQKVSAISVFNSVQKEFESFAKFLETSRPILLFDDQKDVEKTIKTIRDSSQSITKAYTTNQTWTTNVARDVVAFLKTDIAFLPDTDLEICMLNQADIKDFDAIMKTNVEFSTYGKEFYLYVHQFYNLVQFIKRKRSLDDFKNNHPGRNFQIYGKKMGKLTDFTALNQLTDKHKKRLVTLADSSRLTVLKGAFYTVISDIIQTSKVCYTALNQLRELAGGEQQTLQFLVKRITAITGNAKEQLKTTVEKMSNKKFQNEVDDKFQNIIRRFNMIGSCNKSFLTDLDNYFKSV